ncbi:MAG: hypothetical protein WBW53_09565 [Terriglobales bacterium]
MISKTFRIAQMIVLASFALSSAAWAATCSNASLSGTYGLLKGGTDKAGQPTTGVSQLTFDSATGTYTGEDTSSHDGVITTVPVTGTYAVASNCTVAAIALGENIAFVVTSTGFLSLNQTTGVTVEGPGVKQGSPTCTNAGVKGSFGFETTGVFLAGAPVTGPVAFIGELELTVDPSGDGVISGQIAGSEDGTILTFAEEPVTGSYRVDTDCRGRATIKPKGLPEMRFHLVVVDGGKEMLAMETDANTVVSGTLVKGN